MEYILWALAAFGLLVLIMLLAGAIRYRRERRWEERLDVLRAGLDGLLHLVSSGVSFSVADKEAALSMLAGEAHPDVPDRRAFELVISWLSARGTRELDEIGRLAQAQSRHFQAVQSRNRALVLTAVCLAIEGERLRRSARDQIGAAIANGSTGKALMAIWPQPDRYP